LVALKMILGGPHAAPEGVARFRTEAQALARLQHPGIVQVFEVGTHDGHPFFSLELCDGGSLAARLDGTPLPSREAAELVPTVAGAVAAAHQAGVVHRDLKPANVLLSRGDKPLACPLPPDKLEACPHEPKITDFGLAKQLDADEGQTQTGAI